MSDDKNEEIKQFSPKQKAFCHEYLIDFNATQAYIRAGYSPKTAAEGSSRLLRNVKIRTYVDKLINESLDSKKAEIKQRVVNELIAIGFSDISEFANVVTEEYEEPDPFDPENTIKKKIQFVQIKDTKNADTRCIESIKQGKEGIEIKTHSKVKALDSLGKYTTMFAERIELTGKDGGPIATVDYTNLSDEEAKKMFHDKMLEE